jgi:ParB family chromosome partitioning protein
MKLSKAEVDAIIEESPRTFVPFNKLVLSEDHQARRATTPAVSLPELAASIKDSGVLQNLVVVQAPRGRYEVCAGGRRLAALTRLVQQGDIADNYPVPVLVVPADKALIASLAENCFHVLPMHPADEFAAFARLLAQGKSVEDVAAAFGVTPLIVKRRMKLARVSPKLMALYREGGIGLDCLMVLASVDDHQRQLALVRTGDTITVDVPARSIHLAVDDDELARRRAAWQPPQRRYERVFGWLFGRHILQADQGCDFDFLETGFGAPVPEPAIF